MKKYPFSSTIVAVVSSSFILSILLLPQCTTAFATTTQPSSSPTSTSSTSSSIIIPDNNNNIHLPILYENDHLLAISKPPHIPHHDDPQSNNQLGIMSLLRHQQQSSSSSSSSTFTFSYPHRLYGVHRLDRVTSGILLLAKSSSVANTLVTKFKERKVHKYYMALSGKKPRKKKQGWVRGEMVLGRRGSYKLVNNDGGGKKKTQQIMLDNDDGSTKTSSSSSSSGNYAVTRFFTAGVGNVPLSPLLLSQQEVDDDGKEENNVVVSAVVPKTAILFQPHTGKTHQLRVAAKSVGLPILGDARYGGGRVSCSSDDDTTTEEGAVFDRTYLHAAAIHFELDGEEVCIYSPPPFGHLFENSSELDDVFVGMMRKHCDGDDPILQHIDGLKLQ